MSAKSLDHGPMLALAIIAMFAVMPVFFIANRNASIQKSSAASPIRFRVPADEPNVLLRENKSPSPVPTAKPATTKSNYY